MDRIFDTYRANDVRPYVQIGFMPRALSVHPEPYRHHWTPQAKYEEIYTGWAYPPDDYAKWGELAYQWARHCVERYGRAEVETWFWEVWNEPNIGYWRGTPEQFRRLHDHAVAGVRRALPTARVGGCDTAGSGGKFLTDSHPGSVPPDGTRRKTCPTHRCPEIHSPHRRRSHPPLPPPPSGRIPAGATLIKYSRNSWQDIPAR